MAIFRREPRYNGGVYAGGVGTNRDFRPVGPMWLHRVLSTLRPARCYQYGAAGPWLVVTLIAGIVSGGRRRRNVYDKKSQRYAKDKRAAF